MWSRSQDWSDTTIHQGMPKTREAGRGKGQILSETFYRKGVPIGTLILDFQLPLLWENNFCCCKLMWTLSCGVCLFWMQPTNSHGSNEVLWRKRDGTAILSRGEHLDPCLDRHLLLSNSIDQRRFSFIILRFALGDYFLQILTERMLLITSYRLTRKKCCKCKGMIRVVGLVTLCPWENQHRLQEVTLKICSKLLPLQLRVREFQQEQASNAGLVSQGKADPWVWLTVC